LASVHGFSVRLGGHDAIGVLSGAWQLAGCVRLKSPAAIRRAALLRPAAGVGRSAGPPCSQVVRANGRPSDVSTRGAVIELVKPVKMAATMTSRLAVEVGASKRGWHKH